CAKRAATAFYFDLW
nr:immunoglobulin heavy chain junction region [Macaca mulatta]